MQKTGDIELLRRYAREGSEEAFEKVMAAHVNLVYSVALRKTGNAHAAEEITQAVFIILAQKGDALRRGTILSGWLYQTARLTAANYLRTEIRRSRREQEACVQSLDNETGPEVWPQMAPLLEDAMGRLGGKDRDAIVLRFMQGKDFRQIGAAFGASENAAKKRVGRALEKLRKFLAKQGVVTTAIVIGGAISANSVQAAPATLTKSVAAAAVAKGAAAGASTLALVKGALKLMAWTHAKTAVVVGVGLLLAAGTTTVIVERAAPHELSNTDLSWADDPKYWETDSRVLMKLPPVMIIRPTRFAGGGGGVYAGNRMALKNYAVKDLLDTAYDAGWTRTIFPNDMPEDHYDLMYTLPASHSLVLREEFAKRFGYLAHKEIRDTNVLLLKVVNPNPPNLTPALDKNASLMTVPPDQWVIKNYPISPLAEYLEGKVEQPVLDRTGLTGTYEVTLKTPWKYGKPSKEELDSALLEQLGLELVSSREPIEMLIVEKVP